VLGYIENLVEAIGWTGGQAHLSVETPSMYMAMVFLRKYYSEHSPRLVAL